MNKPSEQILDFLTGLEDLNPDISGLEERRLEEWARQCLPEDFELIARQVERLIELYQQAPTIRVGKAILREYFQALEDSAQRLLEQGEISAPPAGAGDAGGAVYSHSLILYSRGAHSALDHCKILSQAQIPEPLSNAADSFRRRVEVVDTVFAIGLKVLWQIDDGRFQQWALSFLESHRGDLSPEVIRDLVLVLRQCDGLRKELVEWLLEWCGDFTLLEHWPLVTRHADRLLGRIAIEKWSRQCVHPRNGALAHLRLLAQTRRLTEYPLLHWLGATLQHFGEGVERFLALNLDDRPDGDAWRHTALLSELRTLASLYPVIMITCDHQLTEPDGAAKMAMAFLGIVGKGLREWEQRITALSEKMILRSFLYDLRENRKPTATIRRFTFGDDTAFNMICNELDLVSRRFDSLAQRDAVIRKLAVYYASYRRGPLLGVEVAKRYKHIARILHEDFLRQFLSAAELEALSQGGFLREMYGMAALAKRFLDHRRALEMTVEEMLASEIEFVTETRRKRLEAIRRLLDGRTVAASS